MRIKKIASFLMIMVVGLAVSACGDNPLLGKWQAVQPNDLMFPLAATAIGTVEFREDYLVTAGSKVKCEYVVEDDSVTVSVGKGGGPGEVFVMDGRSRMSRMVPSIGQVFYKKID